MEKIKSIIVAVALLVGVWLIGYIIGRNHIPDTTKKVQIDTLVRHDTIKVEGPVEIRRIKTTDTLILPITDTLKVRDTVYLVLNRQIKEYRDSLFYAKVSGYDPSLDYIEVYPKTTTISKIETLVQKPSPWRFGLDLGLDYGKTESNYCTPNIGAEIGYKKIVFRTELGARIGLMEGVVLVPQPYWQVGVKYRFVGR